MLSLCSMRSWTEGLGIFWSAGEEVQCMESMDVESLEDLEDEENFEGMENLEHLESLEVGIQHRKQVNHTGRKSVFESISIRDHTLTK